MKSPKHKNNIILFLLFLPLVVFMLIQVKNRNEKLKEYRISKVEIYKTHSEIKSLNKTRRNVARYKYRFEGVSYDKSSQFYSFDVEEGDIYEIKISILDPEIHEVDFSKKLN